MFNNKVFKYRTFNEFSITELNNRTWWFSTAKSFNDPFEFKFVENIIVPKNRKDLIEWLTHDDINQSEIDYLESASISELLDGVNNLVKHTKDEHNSILSDKENTRICCLSQECKDPLMWSHYTDGMKGFVVIYNQFKTQSGEFLPCIPVCYVNEPPIITFETIKLENSHGGFELNRKLIATKHNRWSYEKEVRFIVCPRHGDKMLSRVKLRDGGIFDLPEDAIFGVIVGEYMTKDHFKVIETICKSNNYKMYKASMNSSKYEIDIAETGS
ncbi:DUF2971 domain-containing protein [Psychromonas hadalis]|uniref:DUF2971 domain-containing protein n=1 Tax=Psychromonas hadalis TaxID=211669 RepID=UPI0003B58173|nr:DUF2971 domain-containing protein [Psychromonas hadalis]